MNLRKEIIKEIEYGWVDVEEDEIEQCADKILSKIEERIDSLIPAFIARNDDEENTLIYGFNTAKEKIKELLK